MNLNYEHSDIKNHIEIIKKYANECQDVTEFGVRNFHSTQVFLESKISNLISYDWDKPPYQINSYLLEKAKEFAKLQKKNFEFVASDTRKIKINYTDLLYIDTWHTYEQLLLELFLHSEKVRKYLVIHDTNESIFHGMTCAIEDFLNCNDQWKMEFMVIDIPGITVLVREGESKTNWGNFNEQELNQEIEKQILLYYESKSKENTHNVWKLYQYEQELRFSNKKRWPKTHNTTEGKGLI